MVEQEDNLLELFNFDEEEILETQSFSFETEEKKETPKATENDFFVNEKTEEISFIVEEKMPEAKNEVVENKSFIEERPIEFTFSFTNEAEDIKPSFQGKNSSRKTIKEEV